MSRSRPEAGLAEAEWLKLQDLRGVSPATRFDFSLNWLFIREMTGLAKSFCMLALIAQVVVQPVGQYFCTEKNDLCSVPSTDCCAVKQHDCCEKGSSKTDETPCCIELNSEWEIVPASKGINLPEPLVVDALLSEQYLFSELLSGFESEGRFPAGIDPPPLPSVDLAVVCVRLV